MKTMQTHEERLSQAELGQVQFLPIEAIYPSPENDKLYRPIDPDDADIQSLADSIRQHGVLEPLIVTLDNIIISGHRRYAAACLAGLSEVPCRREGIYSCDARFTVLLREANRQREKTAAERLREEIISANPEDAYEALQDHRQEKARVDVETFTIQGAKKRSVISKAKEPFLRAIMAVIEAMRPYWPLSDRQIHYQLLNSPPLIHASKPDSIYQNNPASYKALTELVTRARLAGHIPMNVIADPTRPVTNWDVHHSTTSFIRQELNDFLKAYRRDLQQTQPLHIEVIGEKNTLQGILRPVAGQYNIPLTIGRGFCSLPPRYDMVQRFQRSGKEQLLLLILSDFDPDGEEICNSFAKSIRDDFGIDEVKAIKVGLTFEQVIDLNLPVGLQAKEKSANYSKFAKQYGEAVYELEAVPPATLQSWLRDALDAVMDLQAFNGELDAEKQDAAELDVLRRRIHHMLQEQGVDFAEVGQS
jgi:hypothetical protein